MPKELSFTLGADPEFNILMYDKKISARKVIESLFHKNETQTERDEFAEAMGFKIAGIGTVGWDGCDSTAELRPAPSNTVEGLTDNIGNLIKVMADKSETFDLSVLSNKGSVGGHIHFSLPPELANSSSKLQILHRQMTSFYLPVMMGENKLNLKIRNRCSYGALSDFRVENGGGTRPMTYEFRVPSAEWITSPKVCKATLAYLATVFNEIVYHQDGMKKHKDILYKSTQQGEALQNLALSDYRFLTNVLLNKIKKSIKSFELYETYKEDIEYILNPNKVLKDKEKVEFNLLYGWEFNKAKPPTKEDLLNQTLVNEKTLELDMDSLERLVWVGFNEDMNVRNFVKEIKKRIIGLKWKLENEYYFFGMKKGVTDYIITNKSIELIKGQELIKTVKDQETVTELFKKMKAKMSNTMLNKQANDKKIIIVGIPYEERMKENYKNFIEMIYNLEKDCKTVALERKNLVNDYSTTETQGEISKVYSAKNEKDLASLQQDERRTQQQSQLVRDVTSEERNQPVFLDEVESSIAVDTENDIFDEDECTGDADECDCEDCQACRNCENCNGDEDCDGCEHYHG